MNLDNSGFLEQVNAKVDLDLGRFYREKNNFKEEVGALLSNEIKEDFNFDTATPWSNGRVSILHLFYCGTSIDVFQEGRLWEVVARRWVNDQRFLFKAPTTKDEIESALLTCRHWVDLEQQRLPCSIEKNKVGRLEEGSDQIPASEFALWDELFAEKHGSEALQDLRR